MKDQTGYRCRSCGIVRLGDVEVAPWCRHGDPTLVAARMERVSDGYLQRLGVDRGVLADWADAESEGTK